MFWQEALGPARGSVGFGQQAPRDEAVVRRHLAVDDVLRQHMVAEEKPQQAKMSAVWFSVARVFMVHTQQTAFTLTNPTARGTNINSLRTFQIYSSKTSLSNSKRHEHIVEEKVPVITVNLLQKHSSSSSKTIMSI